MLGLVVLEGIEQERGRLLNEVLRHKDIHGAFQVDQGPRLVVHQLSGKLGSLVGVGADKVLQQRSIVGRVADLLRVEENFVELASLGKARNDLVGNGRAEVDGKGEVDVGGTDEITELFRAFELHVSLL